MPSEEVNSLIERNNLVVRELVNCPLLQNSECSIPRPLCDSVIARLMVITHHIDLVDCNDQKELKETIQFLIKCLLKDELKKVESGYKRSLETCDPLSNLHVPLAKKPKRATRKFKPASNVGDKAPSNQSNSVPAKATNSSLSLDVDVQIEDFLANKGTKIQSSFIKQNGLQFVLILESIGYKTNREGAKEMSVLLGCSSSKKQWMCKFRVEFVVKSALENVKGIYSEIEETFVCGQKEYLLIPTFLTRTKILSKKNGKNEKYVSDGILSLNVKITIIETAGACKEN